jgi:hypothetical protein
VPAVPLACAAPHGLQNVRLLRWQAGRRHGTEGKEERLIIRLSVSFDRSVKQDSVQRDFPGQTPGKSFCVESKRDFNNKKTIQNAAGIRYFYVVRTLFLT